MLLAIFSGVHIALALGATAMIGTYFIFEDMYMAASQVGGAAYELIRRSSVATGSHGIRTMLPSEEKKGKLFSALNQFEETLEEEAVNNMQPMTTHSPDGSASYKPVLHGLTGTTAL